MWFTGFMFMTYIRYGYIPNEPDTIDVLLFFLLFFLVSLLCYMTIIYIVKTYFRDLSNTEAVKLAVKLDEEARKPTTLFNFHKNIFYGKCFIWLGVISVIAAYGFYLAVWIFHSGLCIIFTGICLVSSIPLFSYGERILRPDVKSLLQKDSRPPVLLLRPFSLDHTASRLLAISSFNSQDMLVPVLEQVGPVIATGRPGETLPPSGAARLYMPHEDWQETVSHLMSSSRVVVLFLFSNILPGKTSHTGFIWEIDQAFKLQPHQLLLMLQPIPCPHSKTVAEENEAHFDFLQGYLERFNRKLPLPLSPEARKAGFIYFAPDWSPHFLGVCRWSNPFSVASTMRPFFQALGLPPPKKFLPIVKHHFIWVIFFTSLFIMGLVSNIFNFYLYYK